MPHPEELGLDRERLARLVDAYAGYADALEERAEVRPWAASSRVLAASYALLVDPVRARGIFAQAAAEYAEQDAPYAAVLAVCAGDTALVRERMAALAEENLSGAGALQRLAVLLGEAWLVASGKEPVDPDARGGEGALERFAFAPSGRLGVPLTAYRFALDEVQSAEMGMVRPGMGRPAESRALPRLAAMLERASEPVRTAMADRFHWERAQSAVLPAEPEAVAACRCVLRAWTRRGRTVDELFALLAGDRVDRVAMVPLELAADLDDEQERGPEAADVTRGGPGPGQEKAPSDDPMRRVFEPDYGH